MIINLTLNAQSEIKRLLGNNPNNGVRVGVKGGGCSGFSYVIDVDNKIEGDQIDNSFGFDVYIDPKSSLYLKGVVIDFEGGFMGKGFKFNNPNATNTCGCGESFSI